MAPRRGRGRGGRGRGRGRAVTGPMDALLIQSRAVVPPAGDPAAAGWPRARFGIGAAVCFHDFAKSSLGSANPGDIGLIDNVLRTAAGPIYAVKVQANVCSWLSPQCGLSAVDVSQRTVRGISNLTGTKY